jgi:hypothetical protein
VRLGDDSFGGMAVQGNCGANDSSRCEDGRTGFMCTECVESDRQYWAGGCAKCDGFGWSTAVAALGTVVLSTI